MTGQRTPHYRIVRALGQGSMGDVYRAEDTTIRLTQAGGSGSQDS